VSRWDDVGVAVRSLWAHRFRSSLSLLGVTLGALGIVFMSSLAQSGFETMRQGVEELGGARLLFVVPKIPVRAKGKAEAYPAGLTALDHQNIVAGVPHVTGDCDYAASTEQSVLADNGGVARADLVAADSRFLDFFSMPLVTGRGFTAREDHDRARLCVVGKKVAAGLWSDSAVGRQLTIGGIRCRVIGELSDRPRFDVGLGFDWLKLVVLPARTATDSLPALHTERVIAVRTDDAANNDIVKRILNVRLVHRHRPLDDFSLLDFAGILRGYYTLFALMQLLVSCIAGLALAVGGIGVMNMMLVGVSERTREIGIRKALGASPADIRMQFLVEAALLSSIGGVLGVGLGALGALTASALVVRLIDTWVGLLSWPAMLAALGTALGTGLVFGWAPARRAGRLAPVEAMRR
jgi:putative ABC transport system permease protein